MTSRRQLDPVAFEQPEIQVVFVLPVFIVSIVSVKGQSSNLRPFGNACAGISESKDDGLSRKLKNVWQIGVLFQTA